MKWSEMKAVNPASLFALLFSSFFILSLIYLLAANLGVGTKAVPELIDRIRGKVDPLQPLPRSLAYAVLIGLTAGVGGTVLALVYNIFSNLVGGVKAHIKE